MIESVVRNVVDSADSSALRGGVGGGGAPPALDIRASVGTSTSPTSTGTKAVTGVGFTPKVVLPFANLQDAVGTNTTILMNIGAGVSSSNRASVSVYSQNGVTTTNTRRRHDNAKIISQPSYTGTDFLVADLASMDSDGFTYNYSVVDSLARILNHICLGGADLEVCLTQQQMNGTNAAQSFAHGLSGAPTGVLFFSAVNNTAPANTGTTLIMSIGAWAGSNQFGAGIRSDNGVTTTLTRRVLSNSTCLAWPSLGRTMAVGSVDATNVNVTYPVGDGYQTYFFMLAIRGAKCQVGTFNTAGSTSPLPITTTGITPKLFLPVFLPHGVTFVGTVRNDLNITIGASDGVNNVSCGITDQNNVTTTNARRFQSSTTLAEYWEGTKYFEGTVAFSGESVILTPTTNLSSAWGQGAWLCIGQ